MNDRERTTVMHLIDRRHDQLLVEIDDLAACIDAALAEAGYQPDAALSSSNCVTPSAAAPAEKKPGNRSRRGLVA